MPLKVFKILCLKNPLASFLILVKKLGQTKNLVLTHFYCSEIFQYIIGEKSLTFIDLMLYLSPTV